MKIPEKRGDKYWGLWHDQDVLVNFMKYVWGQDDEKRNSMMSHRAGRRVEIVIPEDELRKMVDEGVPKIDIAKHFQVSQSKIYSAMRQYGIKADQQGKHVKTKDLDIEEVKKYIDEGLTMAEVAWRCRVGTTKLYKFLKENKLGGYSDDKVKSKNKWNKR